MTSSSETMQDDPKLAPEAPPTALLDFATDEEWEGLERAREARDAAEAEERGLTLKAHELERQAAEARKDADGAQTARRRALVAKALGEEGGSVAPARAPRDGHGADDLQAAAEELRSRAMRKADEASKAHGELRSRTVQMVEDCAHRCSEAYREAGNRVARLHAEIAAAQLVLDSVGQQCKLVGEAWSDELLIPTSPSLAALRGVGAVPGSRHQILPLAGGDGIRCRRAADAACSVARSEIRDLVGSWPLDRKG